ncbi:MAG: DUF1963 domain-containing protein [Planctomycetota bacterium]
MIAVKTRIRQVQSDPNQAALIQKVDRWFAEKTFHADEFKNIEYEEAEFYLGLNRFDNPAKHLSEAVRAFVHYFNADDYAQKFQTRYRLVEPGTSRSLTLGTNFNNDYNLDTYVYKACQIAADGIPPEPTPEERAARFRQLIADGQAKAGAERAKRDKKRRKAGRLEPVGTGKPSPPIKIITKRRDVYRQVTRQYDTDHEDFDVIQALEEVHAKNRTRMLKSLPLGASRIGGVPDLPRGTRWPTFRGKKLPFIAQFDIKDIPSGSRGLLRGSGQLLFFALISNDVKSRIIPIKVLCFDEPIDNLKRHDAPHPDQIYEDWVGVREYRLQPVEALVGNKDVRVKKASDQQVGQLFGAPEIDPNMAGDTADHALKDGDDWITFFSLRSTENMEWSDCGQLHFIARRRDLNRRDFSQTLVCIDSC